MKKTFLLQIPVFGLFIAGIILFASASNISAQNSNDPLYAEAVGPFASQSTSVQRLDAELLTIKLLMSQLTPSSNEYRDAEMKYVYYAHVGKLIAETKAPSSKMIGALTVEGLAIYDNHNATYQQKLANRQGVIALLKA